MASPHIAGVAALVLSAQMARGMTPYNAGQMRLLLQQTSRPFPVAPDPLKPIGTGIVDAAAAIRRATQQGQVESEVLTKGVVLGNQTARTAPFTLVYKMSVPQGTALLNLRTFGGSGDVSVYVGQVNTLPTETQYLSKSEHAGNSESVVLRSPAAGTYYLLVKSAAPFTGVNVLGLN